MPFEYECEACSLNFAVGWYHYHKHDTGYGSRTLLICENCGTMHSVEHPIGKTGVEERVQHQRQPIFQTEELSGRRMILYGDWLGSETLKGNSLKELVCSYCHKKGGIKKDWPSRGAPCPNCSEIVEKPRISWMT